MNKKNTIVSVPSGEIFNCNFMHKYYLNMKGIIEFNPYYNEYVFSDKVKGYVYKYISSNIKIGTKIIHVLYGEGKISGLMDDGWIIWFKHGKFKNYSTTKELIKNINYKFD